MFSKIFSTCAIFIKNVSGKISTLLTHKNIVLPLLAILMGAIGAYVALGFREGIHSIRWVLYQVNTEILTDRVLEMNWWHLLLVTTLGGLLVGVINVKFLGGKRGQGVANIIERNALHNAEMPTKRGFLSAISSSLSIGIGASVGREGPILHLSSTVSTWCAEKLKLESDYRRTLLGCAIAAGVSASFNAPIAGVFFALEVVLGHYMLSAFAPVVISSVIGTMITRVHYGDFPAYVLPHYNITTYWEFPAFILLGIFCGILALGFMKSIFLSEDLFNKSKIPLWIRPAIVGLIIGFIALQFPQVLGVGYDTTTLALNQTLGYGISFLVLLIFMKLLATALCLGCGFGGGVFSPSLYIGALFGSMFGSVLAILYPDVLINPGLYAVVGLAATSAAVLGAPISTILIVFELLGDFKITIGVMSGAAVSTLLVHSFGGTSYYLMQLKRSGIELGGNRAMQILREKVVGDVADQDIYTVLETTKFKQLIDILHTLPEETEAVIVDSYDRFVGTISLSDVKDVAFDELANEDAIEAQMFAHLYPEVLTVDYSIARAISIMEKWKLDRIPVVGNEETMITFGMVDKKELLSAHVNALLQAEAESHGGSIK